jgi:CBS domain containing-hemolysin-like protein
VQGEDRPPVTTLVSGGLTLVALALVALFAGAETGLVSLDVQTLRQRVKGGGRPAERQLLEFARNPERFLALTLIGINMSLVVATSLFSELVAGFEPVVTSLATSGLSVFIFVVCELLPKTAFASRPLELSVRFLPLFRLFDRLLALPIQVVAGLTRWFMDTLKIGGEKRKRTISREELLILLSAGAASGAIRERPHRMARGIIGLKQRSVCEIMKPRVALVALEVSTSLAQARKVFAETGYSRIPVYEGNVDHVVGVVYFKDLYLKASEGTSLRDLLSRPEIVPEMGNAFELFQRMRRHNFQAAVVLDEFGSTTGFITLEDLLEEVVGEIEDELDDSPAELKVQADGTVLARTEVNLARFCEETGIELTETENINTLNGFILARLGRIPQAGECLLLEGHRFEILQADMKRTILVKVHIPHETERSASSPR